MKNIRVFHAVALGESHKVKNIPCQDAAYSFEDHENGVYIGVVSDGHGSKAYFRSDRGSKMLVKIAAETIMEFVQLLDKGLFDAPFTAIPALTTETKLHIKRKVTPQDLAFRRLFSSIISKWNDAVRDDWSADPPKNGELKKLQLPDALIQSYEAGRDIELAYGCTLLAFVRTPNFWIALQLGDGKCIAFDIENLVWEPVPWDDQCSGNTTTSICESNALDNFRYCYGSDRFPVALFIGSDGMDGAYGNMDEFAVPHLNLLYGNMIKSFVKHGFDKTKEEIDGLLPVLSAKGITRDDMSLAGWIDLKEATQLVPLLLQRDIEETETKLSEADEKLKQALNSANKIEQEKDEIVKKIDALMQELTTLKEREELKPIAPKNEDADKEAEENHNSKQEIKPAEPGEEKPTAPDKR